MTAATIVCGLITTTPKRVYGLSGQPKTDWIRRVGTI